MKKKKKEKNNENAFVRLFDVGYLQADDLQVVAVVIVLHIDVVFILCSLLLFIFVGVPEVFEHGIAIFCLFNDNGIGWESDRDALE